MKTKGRQIKQYQNGDTVGDNGFVYISEVEVPKGKGRRVIVKCVCGKEIECQLCNIKTGRTTHCGCKKNKENSIRRNDKGVFNLINDGMFEITFTNITNEKPVKSVTIQMITKAYFSEFPDEPQKFVTKINYQIKQIIHNLLRNHDLFVPFHIVDFDMAASAINEKYQKVHVGVPITLDVVVYIRDGIVINSPIELRDDVLIIANEIVNVMKNVSEMHYKYNKKG